MHSKAVVMPLDHVTSAAIGDISHTDKLWRSTPREAPEDPFNLVGLFPSRPAESYWRQDVENIYGAGAQNDFSVLPVPGKLRQDQSYDEIACKVIEEEDKYGVLAFC